MFFSELTFIILDKEKLLQTNDEILSMVGDTNIFLSRDEETNDLHGEIEIMIAEESARGKGFGWESTQIMLSYAMEALGVKMFVAKIGLDNERSIRMFEKMGFKEESRSEVFQEVTLNRVCDSEFRSTLPRQLDIKEISS